MNENINISDLVEKLCFIEKESELQPIEAEFNCKIKMHKEKHNSLQYTYFFEVDFGLEECFFVEIESGIMNGTRVNNENWGINSMSRKKTVEVLKDIILDEDFYKLNKNLRYKAQAILSANKNKLFEFNRQNNYDNYVTGGNSKLKMDELLSQLHLEYIYKEQEVDCTFV